MENKITYFESARDDNTEETFRLVYERIKGTDISKIVLASTTGDVARYAMDYFKDKGIKLIVVPHQFDFMVPTNKFPAELVSELKHAGHEVYFGTMPFHTDKLYGSNIPTVIADFLRCFSQGVKVCFEIVLMASDGGLLSPGETVAAIAGTGKGSDTALIMQSASTRNLKNLKVNEILCKPINLL
jgi:hypothetical protein